jgi:hypothetical protein
MTEEEIKARTRVLARFNIVYYSSRGKALAVTGEVRVPCRGEWYLDEDGIAYTSYKKPNAYTGKERILREVNFEESH